MALFDSVLNGVNARFNLGDKGASLLNALVAEINSQGLTAFIDRFHHAGLGILADSWISSGANSPLSQGQLRDALGAENLNRLAQQADVATETAVPALAAMIPQVVDLMTPDGVLTDSPVAKVSEKVPETTVQSVESAGGNSLLRIILPLIVLALLVGIAFSTCRPNQETRLAQPGAANSNAATHNNTNATGNSAHSEH